MDFITLPPEVTSALIHAGPGAGSLVAASSAWQEIATNLEDTAEIYRSVLSSLVGAWHGASASAMAAAAAPYVAWLNTTAAQSQQAAAAAEIAAAAFNSTQASVVHPSVVLANRTRLMHLLATNWFGINLPAIAETEQEYQAMWANNSAAMMRYQVTSQQATTQMSQFSSPAATTNSTGQAAQTNAVSNASASNVSNAAVSNAAAPRALISNLAATAADSGINVGVTDPTTGYIGLANQYANQFLSSGYPFNMLSYIAQNSQAQAFQGLGDIGKGLSEGEAALSASLTNAVKGIGTLQAPTAAMGNALTVGKLSLPPAVVGLLPAAPTPAVHLTSAASPLPGGEAGFPMLPPLMPPPISPGSGWRKRKPNQYDDLEVGKELKGSVIRTPPSAG
jgi:PPE-repeat protein